MTFGSFPSNLLQGWHNSNGARHRGERPSWSGPGRKGEGWEGGRRGGGLRRGGGAGALVGRLDFQVNKETGRAKKTSRASPPPSSKLENVDLGRGSEVGKMRFLEARGWRLLRRGEGDNWW